VNLQRDYLIYDYQSFVMSCFETSVHSYFGFAESSRNRFYLYDLTTREPFLECCVDTYEQSSLRSKAKKVKVEYELESCLKFRLPKNGQLVATAFHKYINNGILYNIKPFNHYENQYEDSLALIEITDGFIGSNCYCNTNVYISQKYTDQPGQYSPYYLGSRWSSESKMASSLPIWPSMASRAPPTTAASRISRTTLCTCWGWSIRRAASSS
jgi:hypothetical protein